MRFGLDNVEKYAKDYINFIQQYDTKLNTK